LEVPLSYRVPKEWQQVQLGGLDTENKELRRVAKGIVEFFTEFLCNAAGLTCAPSSIPPGRVVKCAHDVIADPSTNEKLAPHLVIDCVELCKPVADIAAKEGLGDSGLDPYDETAANARETVKATEKQLNTAKKQLTKANKRAKAAAKNAANLMRKQLRKWPNTLQIHKHYLTQPRPH